MHANVNVETFHLPPVEKFFYLSGKFCFHFMMSLKHFSRTSSTPVIKGITWRIYYNKQKYIIVGIKFLFEMNLLLDKFNSYHQGIQFTHEEFISNNDILLKATFAVHRLM